MNPGMRIVVASALVAVAAGFASAPAGAAQRWAGPEAARTSGPCLAVDPCTLTAALHDAAANDEVLLAAGRYVMTAPLTAPVRVTLRGADAERPVIVGSEPSEDHPVLTFTTAGTLRHVEIRATQGQQDALALRGGVAEDVILSSEGGNGAKVYGAANGTLLRDAVVTSAVHNDGDRAAVRLRDAFGGDVALRNVTALAPGANGIRCDVDNGVATIVNTIAHGGIWDIRGGTSNRCRVTHSNFRSARSLAPGTANQEAEPRLEEDGRPLSDSPTIDAGTTDTFVSSTDPAGCARTAPDIGAFEHCASPVTPPPAPVTESPTPATTPEPTATPEPPAPTPVPDTEAELPAGIAPPAQGTSVVVSPAQGTVRIRQPGTNRFIELEAGAQVPVGSEIDASKGRVTLVTAVAGGLQDGTFWGGRFKVTQQRKGDGMTSLTLQGAGFKGCPKRVRASAAASKKKDKPKRKLWSKDDNGRFRTHGHNSVATARGTHWLTEDTCAGTRTRVLEGAVAVRDNRTKRTTLIRAGSSYLARR